MVDLLATFCCSDFCDVWELLGEVLGAPASADIFDETCSIEVSATDGVDEEIDVGIGMADDRAAGDDALAGMENNLVDGADVLAVMADSSVDGADRGAVMADGSVAGADVDAGMDDAIGDVTVDSDGEVVDDLLVHVGSVVEDAHGIVRVLVAVELTLLAIDVGDAIELGSSIPDGLQVL